MDNRRWIIVKLGGCVITDKCRARSARFEVIQQLVSEIVDSGIPLIIVHGGGSFGHPLAKQFEIIQGYNISIPDQVYGFTQTHQAMDELNQLIVKEFQARHFPVMPMQPSAVFSFSTELQFHGLHPLLSMMKLGITPILYGDGLFSDKQGFTVLSGDLIIQHLCQIFPEQIEKVIFTIDQDGILRNRSLDASNTNANEIMREITIDELDQIPIYNPKNRIDVTKGIIGKFEAIRKICQMNISVQIVNGLKPNVLKKALLNQPIISSIIHR